MQRLYRSGKVRQDGINSAGLDHGFGHSWGSRWTVFSIPDVYKERARGFAFGDCRNAAQCESLGHRPRNRAISNTKALKGRDRGISSSFRPFGAFCVSIHLSQGDALGFHILGLWPRPLFALPQRTSSGRICDRGLSINLETFRARLVRG